jgi:hypothetical protein
VPDPSKAETVNENVPAAVGTPASAPAAESESPVGSDPCVTRTVYGAFGPLTVIVCVYAAPTVPPVSDDGEIANDDDVAADGGDATTIVYDVVLALCPLGLASSTENVYDPTVVGVPEMSPPLDSERPGGSAPDESEKTSLPFRVLVSCCEYDTSTVPAGSDADAVARLELLAPPVVARIAAPTTTTAAYARIFFFIRSAPLSMSIA